MPLPQHDTHWPDAAQLPVKPCAFVKSSFNITVISMTHTRTLSKADGLPPLCTCPSTVILVSCCRFSTTTCLTFSAVIGSPSWSMAPSATIMIFSRCPVERSYFIQQRNMVRKGERTQRL